MKTKMMTSTMGDDQFYPTPGKLTGMMLSEINWKSIETILEPSAGKGDLVKAAANAFSGNTGYRRRKVLQVDCIEIDPDLRQILGYNFSNESIDDIRERYQELDRLEWQADITSAEKEEYKALKRKITPLECVDMRIIHDDFLTFRGSKRYDLIIMNPPFANGDRHLLKALKLQENGGQIVCLLNAETLRNPYSKTRQLLQRKLQEYGAKITFVDDAFKKAERIADVDVAIVKVAIPSVSHESTIYEKMKKAVEFENQYEQCSLHEPNELVYADFLSQMVQRFEIEVAASLELIRQYEALRPYILDTIPTESESLRYSSPILTLCVGDKTYDKGKACVNRYLSKVRYKYWHALLNNKAIIGRLTSKLQTEYRNSVDKMADYDFSLFNIRQIMAEINSRLVEGIQDSIMALFDKLTSEHSWYPESKNNIHYFDGWVTNKAHKIGKKSIIPTNGVFSDYSREEKKFKASYAYNALADIEKVFNYLDGRMTADVDLHSIMLYAERQGQTKNIQCKYFAVDFYKKGTCHIKFTDQEIVDRLNIYAAQNRNWLPPHYGKVNYEDLQEAEKAVVDSFQGKKAYETVMDNKHFYLASIGSDDPMLLLAGFAS